MNMKYEQPSGWSLAEVEAGLSSESPDELCRALLAAIEAQHSKSLPSQLILRLFNHSDIWVRRTAINVAARMAPYYSEEEAAEIEQRLVELIQDDDVSEEADDAMWDIQKSREDKGGASG